MLTAPVLSANAFSVSLTTQSGHVYQCQFKTSLSQTAWTSLPLVAGNGGLLILTDNTIAGQERFYRVVKW